MTNQTPLPDLPGELWIDDAWNFSFKPSDQYGNTGVRYVRAADTGWRTISEMGEPIIGKRFWLAAWIVPSAECARNGGKAHWHVADGIFLGRTWTGILGGKPSHYMPYFLPPPPQDGKDGAA